MESWLSQIRSRLQGAKLMKRQNLPEVPQAQEPGKTQPNGQAESPPKPSKKK